jgi:hypothetical protein
MIKSLGIIPAAGNAERFGGVYKELLPAGSNETLLHRAVRTMGICEMTSVVTNPQKVAAHMEALSDKERTVFIGQCDYGWIEQGAWAAIFTAITEIEAENYYYMMPDTYIPTHTFAESGINTFAIHTFETDMPDRFGILKDGYVTDKPPLKGLHSAWGALSWSKGVRDFWLHRKPDTYTEAINTAINEFGYVTIPLDYYHDMASWEDYQRLVRHEL